METVCFNCNQFFPASISEPTEFGICLQDNDFEPYIDELFEDKKSTACRELIQDKKFSGGHEACDDFEELDQGIEIDGKSSFGLALSDLSKKGTLNIDSFKVVLLEEQLRQIDLKNLPVTRYINDLKNSNIEKRLRAISTLGGLIIYGNTQAFEELLAFFKLLPAPHSLKEVHFKIEILKHLKNSDTKVMLIPILIDKLYQTVSNNTTRQWITEIFQVLKYCPQEEVRAPIENMLKDKRFSYRLKQKMKDILNR